MQRRNFQKTSGVIIDRCGEHGTWLEADELEQIAGFILSGGRPGAQRLMKELEERDKQPVRVIPAGQHRVMNTGSDVWTVRNPERSLATDILRSLVDLLA